MSPDHSVDTEAAASLAMMTEPLINQEDPRRTDFSSEGEGEEAGYGAFQTVRTSLEKEEFYRLMLSNTRRILALTWFAFAGRAIWSQSVLSIFVFLLHPKEPQRVGYITAAMGISQVFSGIPARYLVCSRAWKRHHLLKLAAIIGIGAMGLTFYSTMIRIDYFWLLGGLSAWGAMWGITDVALPSLFADSIPVDNPDLFYIRGSRIIRSSNVFGPLFVVGIFSQIGDVWTIQNCAVVITAGLGLYIPMALLLCCLSDTSDEDEDNLPHEIHVEHDDNVQYSGLDLTNRSESASLVEEGDVSAFLNTTAETARVRDEQPVHFYCNCCKQSTVVPALISLADTISGTASGISIRYFPLFFVEKLGLSPIQVQFLYLVTPLGQAILKSIGKTMAGSLGASSVSVCFHWAFIALLGSMLYCYQIGAPIWAVCMLYLAHAFLMNATSVLTQAILLSVVSDRSLSKIYSSPALEVLQLILWSVGAAGGGYIVSLKGSISCFYATVCLQLLGSVPVALLCCIGPTREKVNEFLFPPESESSEGGEDFSFDHEVERQYRLFDSVQLGDDGTHFEDSREMMEDSDSSNDNFFDCNITSEDERDPFYETEYRDGRCVYPDGSPSYCNAGESTTRVPAAYLHACNGKRHRAMERWRATQDWRHKNQVWQIHTEPNQWYLRIKKNYPHFIHGRTKEGYPVIYEQPGKMKLKELFREGCEISDMTRWYTFLMEYLSNYMHTCRRQEEFEMDSSNPIQRRKNIRHQESQTPSWGFVVVMDMEGAGISMLSSDVLSYLKQAGDINSSHYPLSMKESYLVNAGPLVSRLWSVVKDVLPDSVQLEILQSSSSLQHHISEDQIPPEFGGTSPFSLGNHPDEIQLLDLVQQLHC